MFLFVLLIGVATALGDERKELIHNASDLIKFSSNVMNGTNYSGTTVLLSSDIKFTEDLSQQFKPIGNYDNYFSGTFYGQGYIISDLIVNLSSHSVGLFGFSRGTTIKNVVVGKSCSFNSYNSETSDTFAGGIIGGCYSMVGPCYIENNVNIGTVTFTGRADNILWIGGIVAAINTKEFDAMVKNCVNYGLIVNLGSVSNFSMMGGIIGEYSRMQVLNSLNYGEIIHNGTVLGNCSSFIGGIIGKASNVNVENCVNSGNFSVNKATNNVYIGTIIGLAFDKTTKIIHCFWTNGSEFKECGSSSSNVVISNSSKVILNSTITNELNKYAEKDNSNKWLILNLEGGNINGMEQSIIIVAQKRLPEPQKERHIFSGWFTESNESYNSNTTDNYKDSILFAHWEKITKQVEIIFGVKNMSEDDVQEFLKRYTDANFTIIRIEPDSSDDVKIIIEFIDESAAKSFVDTINASSDSTKTIIKKVCFIVGNPKSFSPIYYPLILFSFLVM